MWKFTPSSLWNDWVAAKEKIWWEHMMREHSDVHPLCKNVQITPLYGVTQGDFLGPFSFFIKKSAIIHAQKLKFPSCSWVMQMNSTEFWKIASLWTKTMTIFAYFIVSFDWPPLYFLKCFAFAQWNDGKADQTISRACKQTLSGCATNICFPAIFAIFRPFPTPFS